MQESSFSSVGFSFSQTVTSLLKSFPSRSSQCLCLDWGLWESQLWIFHWPRPKIRHSALLLSPKFLPAPPPSFFWNTHLGFGFVFTSISNSTCHTCKFSLQANEVKTALWCYHLPHLFHPASRMSQIAFLIEAVVLISSSDIMIFPGHTFFIPPYKVI